MYFSVPYNVKSVTGHVCTHIAEFLGVASLVAVLCTLSSLFYGVCAYSHSLLTDLENHFTDLDHKLRPSGASPVIIRSRLIQIVEFHNSIYRL